MSYIQQPALQSFSDSSIATSALSKQGGGFQRKALHVVTAAYNFDGDTPGPIQLGALAFEGTSFTIDPDTFSNAGLGQFKSLCFSASFGSNNSTDTDDGSLFVYSQSTGQLIAISPLIPPPALDVAQGVTKTVSGAIPIVAHGSGKIIIAKAVSQPSVELFGQIFISLYDFTIPPFVNTGYGYGLPI